jgi:hypothetical protein
MATSRPGGGHSPSINHNKGPWHDPNNYYPSIVRLIVESTTFVWDLLISLDGADLIKSFDVGGESAVHAQHLVVDDGSDGKKVEDLAAVAPGVCISVFVLTFVVEAVDLRDLPRFVVAPEKSYLVRPSGFEEQQSGKGFQTVVTSVNKVSHKYVVGVWDLATASK